VTEGGFPYRLVLLRHGQSEWNAAQVFTGWENAHLTARGEVEAARAGALQGRSKPEVIQQYGKQQVMTWRRSYDVPPPPLAEADAAARAADPRYRAVPPDALPRAESLADELGASQGDLVRAFRAFTPGAEPFRKEAEANDAP
jgi:2,3-bisphosphoglycerate-dependent phosphoglycerate mutase